ncbi:hypothetical protein HFP72_32635 [Nocardiopsis sp. ARC36]
MKLSKSRENIVNRVNEEELEYDYEAYGAALFLGKPFTGEAVEKSGDKVISLTTFAGGVEDGPKKEWYESGQLRSEGEVRHPRGAVGVWREWSESGQLTQRKEFDEKGNMISWRKWDEIGNMTKDVSYKPLW